MATRQPYLKLQCMATKVWSWMLQGSDSETEVGDAEKLTVAI
jgi:hypothetical protein